VEGEEERDFERGMSEMALAPPSLLLAGLPAGNSSGSRGREREVGAGWGRGCQVEPPLSPYSSDVGA
jgi:hypothetical protein